MHDGPRPGEIGLDGRARSERQRRQHASQDHDPRCDTRAGAPLPPRGVVENEQQRRHLGDDREREGEAPERRAPARHEPDAGADPEQHPVIGLAIAELAVEHAPATEECEATDGPGGRAPRDAQQIEAQPEAREHGGEAERGPEHCGRGMRQGAERDEQNGEAGRIDEGPTARALDPIRIGALEHRTRSRVVDGEIVDLDVAVCIAEEQTGQQEHGEDLEHAARAGDPRRRESAECGGVARLDVDGPDVARLAHRSSILSDVSACAACGSWYLTQPDASPREVHARPDPMSRAVPAARGSGASGGRARARGSRRSAGRRSVERGVRNLGRWTCHRRPQRLGARSRGVSLGSWGDAGAGRSARRRVHERGFRCVRRWRGRGGTGQRSERTRGVPLGGGCHARSRRPAGRAISRARPTRSRPTAQ